MIILRERIVGEIEKKVRFSKYAINIFTELPSLNSVKKTIKLGELLLNKKKAKTGDWVKKGDLIHLVDLQKKAHKNYEFAVKVKFEDNFLAVIHKPAGIDVSGNKFRTIENSLPFNLQKSSEIDALKYPRPVHRIDNQTEGLLLIAKNKNSQINLSRQFQNRNIKKKYIALVIGKTPPNGIIDSAIDGQPAHTEFKTLETIASNRSGFLSLLELLPKTGRTHQLRIHLSSEGYPILGDKLYGKENLILKHKGLFLCATELSFKHPVSKELINVTIGLPHKFQKQIENEKKMWRKKSVGNSQPVF